MVPSPAVVGRDDVAALAVAAALFASSNATNEAFHYTLGVRWVGQQLDPYPPQGRKTDGLADAHLCMQRVLKTIRRAENRSKKRRMNLHKRQFKESLSTSNSNQSDVKKNDMILRLAHQIQKQRQLRPKPYGICVAIPVYLLLGLFAKTLLRPILQFIPGGQTYLIPALGRIHGWLMMVLSMWMTRVLQVLPWLTRRQQFISF